MRHVDHHRASGGRISSTNGRTESFSGVIGYLSMLIATFGYTSSTEIQFAALGRDLTGRVSRVFRTVIRELQFGFLTWRPSRT